MGWVNGEMAHWVKVPTAFLTTWIRTPGPTRCKERIKSWFVLQPLYTCTPHHHVRYINNHNTEVFLRLFFGGKRHFLLGKCRAAYTWGCHMVRPVFCGPTECQVCYAQWRMVGGGEWMVYTIGVGVERAWWSAFTCLMGVWHAPRATQKKSFGRAREDNRYPVQPDGGSQRPFFPCTEIPTPEPEPGARRSKEQTLSMGRCLLWRPGIYLLGWASVSSGVSCISEVNHFV